MLKVLEFEGKCCQLCVSANYQLSVSHWLGAYNRRSFPHYFYLLIFSVLFIDFGSYSTLQSMAKKLMCTVLPKPKSFCQCVTIFLPAGITWKTQASLCRPMGLLAKQRTVPYSLLAPGRSGHYLKYIFYFLKSGSRGTSVFSTNTQARFALVVLDCVLGLQSQVQHM